MIYPSSDPANTARLSWMLDLFTLFIVLLFTYTLVQPMMNSGNASSSATTLWTNMKESTRTYLNNAYSILDLGVFLTLFYIGCFALGVPMSDNEKPWSAAILESKGWVLLMALVGVQFFNKVLKIPIVDILLGDASFSDPVPTGSTGTDAATAATTTSSSSIQKEEVFNISNNIFTYEDAQAVCTSLNARLATYDEIEDAYNHGAEWKSYGWSDGQHAYFPTQKETWQKLQSSKGHEHDLGRPGVNGGYFANKMLKFGVNCYGVKPEETAAERELMEWNKNSVVPKNPEDVALEAKVDYWKQNREKYVVINSYNQNNWSRY